MGIAGHIPGQHRVLEHRVRPIGLGKVAGPPRWCQLGCQRFEFRLCRRQRNLHPAQAGDHPFDIAVDRSQLPVLAEDEYYWNDLIGLGVVTRDGKELGRVSGLMQTGTNDVLVVSGERERLIPFIREQVVLAVDAEARRIEVDWDPDF